jgi:AsmA-like protein
VSLKRIVVIVLVLAAVAVATVAAMIPITSARARQAVIAQLSARLDSTVALESFEMRLLPRLSASGRGLAIHHHGRQDVPPLISIRQFAVSGGLIQLLRGHVNQVTVEGLDIMIPPRDQRDRDEDQAREEKEPQKKDENPAIGSMVIDRLESLDARVTILKSDPKKSPKVWAIHRLRMRDVGDQSMPFDAVLTNAVPPGEIATEGTFGPWDREEPGRTPLAGTFQFDRADLSVFKGISGILSSTGSFEGELGRLDVDGQTDTPDFTVEVGGHPVPLHTTYSATVDGTNGDTILNRIDASFLKTSLVAKGRVIDTTPGQPGRMVKLDVVIDRGRIEDVLLLAVKSTRPLVGGLSLQTSLIIPPGDRDVVEKLKLDGRFTMTNSHFTNVNVSQKITELSQRARGKQPNPEEKQVGSDFAGRFTLDGGKLTIPAVAFDVPGAGVRLAGYYNLRQEDMDFRGSLLTDAKVSQMTTGWKSWLLKVIDPLFGRDGGGSSIPIKVTGTRKAPSFGLDTGRVFSRDKERDVPKL